VSPVASVTFNDDDWAPPSWGTLLLLLPLPPTLPAGRAAFDASQLADTIRLP
jgi:hypothetical protein